MIIAPAQGRHTGVVALIAEHTRLKYEKSAGVLYLSEGTGAGQRSDPLIIIVQDPAKNLLGMLSQQRRSNRIHRRGQLHADRRFDVGDGACSRMANSVQTMTITSLWGVKSLLNATQIADRYVLLL